MDCRRVEELLSDHLEGALHEILRAEVERHLASCQECRELREAFGFVVETLRSHPVVEAPESLAQRAARRALSAPLPVRPAIVVPSWMQAAAAGFALIAIGTMLMLVGPERSTRAAQRLVSQTVAASQQLIEKKERIVEDVRILGVVLSTAFEGRIDRINERVEDYRSLLEKRRSSPEPRSGSETRPVPVGLAAAFGTGPRRGA